MIEASSTVVSLTLIMLGQRGAIIITLGHTVYFSVDSIGAETNFKPYKTVNTSY